MNEVSCRATVLLFDALDRRSIPRERLIEGLPVTLQELQAPGGRLDWELYTDLLERLEELLGGPERLHHLGTEMERTRSALGLDGILGFVVSPRQMFWVTHRFLGPGLFGVIASTWDDLPDGRFRLTTRIAEGYRPCPQVFRIFHGCFQSVPVLVGREPAEVDLEVLEPSRASYLIRAVEPRFGRRQRLANAARVVLGTPRVIEDFAEQQAEILAGHRALSRAHQRIRIQTDQLRESEARWRALVHHVPETIVMIDRDMHLVFLNRPLLGMVHEEVVGRSIRQIAPQIVDDDSIGRLEAVFTDGRSYHHEFSAWDDAGEQRHFTAHVGPIVREGRVDSILVVVRDVTEQRRSEERQRRLEERMQTSRRLESLGLLAGGVAHDFNNLIQGIMANVGLALADLPEGSAARERVARVELAATRAGDLTSQLLTYSGRGPTQFETVHLPELLVEVRELVRPLVPDRVQLRLEVPPDLPQVQADPTQLRQLVMNLFTNAVQAIGGEEGTIRVRLDTVHCEPLLEQGVDELPGGPHARLQVEDTGCGMDEETRARIFDPFFTTRRGGRGLGLATVLGIVRSHHGRLEVQSTPGQGSVFRVLLPVVQPIDD